MRYHSCARFWTIESPCPFVEREDHDESMDDEGEAARTITPPKVAAAKEAVSVPTALVRVIAETVSPSPVMAAVVEAIANVEHVGGLVEAMATATRMPVGLSKGATGQQESIPQLGKGRVSAPATPFLGGFSNAARAGAEVAAITTAVHALVRRGATSGPTRAEMGRKVERAVTRQIRTIINKVPTKSSSPGAISGSFGPVVGAGGRLRNLSQQFVPGITKAPGDFFFSEVLGGVVDASGEVGFWF